MESGSTKVTNKKHVDYEFVIVIFNFIIMI